MPRGRGGRSAPRRRHAGAETRKRVAREVAPVLRGMLGRDRRVVLRFDDAEDIRELAGAPEAARAHPGRPGHARPHDLLETAGLLRPSRGSDLAGRRGRRAARGGDRFARDYTAYFEAHRHGELMKPGGRHGVAVGDPDAHGPVPARRPAAWSRNVHERERRTHGRDRRRHLPPHGMGHPGGVGARSVRVALRAGRLQRRVLAARALQAPDGAAREGAGAAGRAGHRRRERHRPGGGPAACSRGRPRRRDRPRRRRRPPGGRGGRGGRGAGAPLGLGMDVTSEASVEPAVSATSTRTVASTSSSRMPASPTRRRSTGWRSPTGSGASP